MNAINFIKQHGVEKARKVVEGAPEWARYYSTTDGEYYLIELNAVNLKELKRLVESVDEINGFGGIGMAKLINQTVDGEHLDLEQAIADYESIYSSDMGDDSHIENRVSPHCKVSEACVDEALKLNRLG